METNYISSASLHCNQQNNLPSAEKKKKKKYFSETFLRSVKDNLCKEKKQAELE